VDICFEPVPVGPADEQRVSPARWNVIAESQADVVNFLSSPSTHGGSAVERIDTHTAFVFLAGSRAYKLKRAVRYDYLDFSTVERRHLFCDEEVRLNRRTAPALYRGVVPVCRSASGALSLGGSGTAVDWLVEMNRFDQSLLFDRLAGAGRLERASMGPLASAIASFHALAAARSDHGGTAGMASSTATPKGSMNSGALPSIRRSARA